MITFRMGDIEWHDVEVVEAIEQAGERGARRIGFETRSNAQRSIVDDRNPSSPGTPPHSHDGTLRRWIMYAFDRTAKSIVIGPKLLAKQSQDVPSATEFGGFSVTTKGRLQHVAPRPFMTPAFAGSLNQISEVFLNSVR